jgi:tetratricopeptide (TPR) repeat protein
MAKKKYPIFNEIFSCKNPQDVIGEFLFLIANLYSTEGDIQKSNFYLKISNYLNPKFKFNLSLFVENYYEIENFELTEFFLKTFQNDNPIYYWYKLKKKAEIIKKEKNENSSFDFIFSEFSKIKSPSPRVILDMANIAKNFEKYDLSIIYYSKLLLNLDRDFILYADILYRRGSCFERLGQYKKADADFLNSLKINENSYTLNYLAYSWLERNYKIDLAIEMLEKANKNNNDPYIIDSVGWGYYLTKDYIKAEVFLKRAVMLMPNDPIVNDHYGDVLWKLGRKMQANYFWKNVLTFKNIEDKMKNNINLKLLNGPDKT